MNTAADESVCRYPEFRYIWERQCWSACINCRKLAWDHPQADPVQDLRNRMVQVRTGLPPDQFPPTMRPLEPQR